MPARAKGVGEYLEPKDIIWRLSQCLDEHMELIMESIRDLHPKQHGDLINALRECEQLTKTQLNVLSRMGKKYS